MNIIRRLDSILAALDLRTAKNMRRIQRGEQPNLGFGDLQEASHHDVSGMHKQPFRIEEYLYSAIDQLSPIVDIIDQFKFSDINSITEKMIPDLKAKAAKLQVQIDKLRQRLNRLKEKRWGIVLRIKEDYYRDRYDMKGYSGQGNIDHYVDNTMKAIFFAKKGNEELVQLVRDGKVEVDGVMRWLENQWEQMREEDRGNLHRLISESDLMKKFHDKYSSIMDELQTKIDSLTKQCKDIDKQCDDLDEKFRKTSHSETVQVRSSPVFEVNDISDAYLELFEKFPSNKSKQRIYPEDLRFNLSDYRDDFQKSLSFRIDMPDHTNFEDWIDWDKNAIIVISRAAYDIVGKDTERLWSFSSSYTDLKSDTRADQNLLPGAVQKGFMVAYICYEDDRNIKNPIGSAMILSHFPKDTQHPSVEEINGDNILTVDLAKGFFPDILVDKLQDFLNKNWNSKHSGGEIGKRFQNPTMHNGRSFHNQRNRFVNVGYDEEEGIVDPWSYSYVKKHNLFDKLKDLA